jgi:hypothetical protein
MWTHTRMSFSSHTFTSLPLVHTPNPDFLGRQLWLCFSLVREFPRSRLPNQTSDRFPNFPSSEVRDFTGSRFQTFACSWLRGFADSRFPKIACPRLQGFAGPRFLKVACSRLRGFTGQRFLKIACSRLRGFAGPRFLKITNALSLKTYLKNFVKLDVSRVTNFPEFPNNWSGWGGPPSGPTSARWSIASSRCFFLGCLDTLSFGAFWSLLD